MSSKAIVCAACGAPVSYGRLSCPACGELLASVVGAPRRGGTATATKRASRTHRATPSVLVDVAAAAASPADAAAAEPAGAVAAVADVPVPASPVRGPSFVEPEAPLAEPAFIETEPTLHAPAATVALAADAVPNWPDGAPQWPDEPPRWRDERAPAVAAAAAVAAVPAMVTSPSLANAPGAYVPPILPATPAGPPAPARAWAGHPAGDAAAAQAGTPATSSDTIVDPARLTEFIGWLAVAGSAMAAVGFVLPWGMSVIGASGVDYFDRWGMAGPFHPLVVVGALVILGLALVPNPIPLWARVGLPGVGLGALLLGLVWPYLLYLPGTGPGVAVVAIGSIILVVAGIAAVVVDRHAPEDRAV